MANPIILIALLVGAGALMLKKPKAATTPPTTAPNALPEPAPGSQTVQVPVSLPGVAAGNQPTVTVTKPPIDFGVPSQTGGNVPVVYGANPVYTTSTPPDVDATLTWDQIKASPLAVNGSDWTISTDTDALGNRTLTGPAGGKYSIPQNAIHGVQGHVQVEMRDGTNRWVYDPVVLAPASSLPPVKPGTATTTAPTPQQILTTAATQVAQALPQLAPVLTPPVAVQAQETSAAVDPHGTVALAGKLINAESAKGWKTALASDVMAWQKKMSLVADGKFGPKSALLMGNEVGVLPLLRYYSSTGGTLAAQLTAYRTSLGALASQLSATNLAHSLALRSSAMYETGLGYASSPAPVPATARVAQATALTAAIKGA